MAKVLVRAMRRAARTTLSLVALAVANNAQAQYFGRNKAQYEHFDFRVAHTDHFDIYFYPAESLAAADAARMAERWYVRHAALLPLTFEHNPLIFYADPPDFQQSNVIEGIIGQGTGGVTEGLRDRVIMPFTGSYAEMEHVLGHELVHVFQYHLAQGHKNGGLPGSSRVESIPLWLIEGMAEYLSLGRDDPNTTMWLRDAVLHKDLPTIRQLTSSGKYFPYRYGEALWAFIGGTWGDDAVYRVYRAAIGSGWEAALKSSLGVSSDSLTKLWHASIRTRFAPFDDRTPPDRVGRELIKVGKHNEQNVAPALTPDGQRVAFFSSRGLFDIDLFIADVATGRIVKQLTSVNRERHFEALSFISSGGTWSPDGKRLAFVTYARGDNEIEVVDADGKHERTIKTPGIGAVADPAWSPDGNTLAFSGLKGGLSDLYLYDFSNGAITQLTSDREAQLQPAWSPDGKTLAFVTDRGDSTDFAALRTGPMRLALMNVADRSVRLIPTVARGKEINPQFSPDGRTLYYVGDPDGISDLYALTLATNERRRVTRIATGVSGITALSPAFSVARTSGDIVMSVFDRQGYALRAISGRDAPAVTVAMGTADGSGGILPPVATAQSSKVEQSLNDTHQGLRPPQRLSARRYHPGLSLDYVGGPSLGVATGGAFGTAVGGGIVLGFSDMLGNHLLQTAVDLPGNIRDGTADLLYINRAHSWTWGAEAYHVPLANVFVSAADGTFTLTDGTQVPGSIYTEILARTYFDNVQLLAQKPVSTTRRFEFSAGVQRVSFGNEVDSLFVVGGQIVNEVDHNTSGGKSLTLGATTAAYVTDYSYFGFTSPVAGARYRVDVTPVFGALQFMSVNADYRRYFFMRPFTLALRGEHFGRYGSGSESNLMQPLYLGYPSMVRGYNVESFDPSECTVVSSTNSCPQFSRLLGSRVAIANAEFRIPLFGTSQFGLLNVPFLPLEIAPFIDAGVAWTSTERPSIRFDRNTADRVPVVSSGISARANVLGAIIVELYWVNPYQRPGKGRYFGFQIAPGW
ncbi:MAG TPA: hypothetical protein VE967_02770 [Gemmatimonadaceae bacterium]|nr:hypothetical protein [Gemmatimonadaceae bacterium]